MDGPWLCFRGTRMRSTQCSSEGAQLLASGSDDKTVRVWDLTSKKTVQSLPHDKAVYGLSWRADGGMLATGAGKLVQLFAAS